MNRKHEILTRLAYDLNTLGFGTDEPVNGGDLVDVMANHFEAIKQALQNEEAPPARVVIHLDGGIVTHIDAETATHVLIFDYDIEGVDEDQVVVRQDADGTDVMVFKNGWLEADVTPAFVGQAFDSLMDED